MSTTGSFRYQGISNSIKNPMAKRTAPRLEISSYPAAVKFSGALKIARAVTKEPINIMTMTVRMFSTTYQNRYPVLFIVMTPQSIHAPVTAQSPFRSCFSTRSGMYMYPDGGVDAMRVPIASVVSRFSHHLKGRHDDED